MCRFESDLGHQIGMIMKYTILEDASPYYIRFTWDGLPELVTFIKSQSLDKCKASLRKGYTHYDYSFEEACEIVSRLPMKDDFSFKLNRVAVFLTPPGSKSPVHKDAYHMISINIPLEVLDNKCGTSWWDDESVSQLDQLNTEYSRMIQPEQNIPHADKQMTAQPNECILFNCDIYHAWDNSQSENQRSVLTLRVNNTTPNFFDNAKEILFGGVAQLGERLLCKQ